MLSPFLLSPLKTPIPSPLLLFTNLPTPASWPWHFPILGLRDITWPRASPPIDDRLGHPLLHMQLEPWVSPCVLFGWWFSPWELWGYWSVHIVVRSMGLLIPSAPWVLSLTFLLETVHCSLIYSCKELERTQMSFKEEWMQKMWYIYTMEYYSAIKNNGFMKFLGKWMHLGDIILSEVTQSQKNTHDMHSLISGY